MHGGSLTRGWGYSLREEWFMDRHQEALDWKKLSEDREEWMKEVLSHCERCHDDEVEPSWVQERRVRCDSREAWTEKRVEVTEDRALRAREKMMKNKADGLMDGLVSECMKSHIGSGRGSEGSVRHQQRGGFTVWCS